jgi:thiamine pyrophosphate-dependent acetolactate synthase large subunit-like protein
VDELRALSDRLKAPLIHSVKGKDLMPYDDPHWMGGIGMTGTKAVYNAIMRCDLLVMLGPTIRIRNSSREKALSSRLMTGHTYSDGVRRLHLVWSARSG